MWSIKTSQSIGLLKKPAAPPAKARALTFSSGMAVMKMIGVLSPLARSSLCSSMPLILGICTSAIRHEVRFDLGRLQELFGGRECVRHVAEGAYEALRRHTYRIVVIDNGHHLLHPNLSLWSRVYFATIQRCALKAVWRRHT